MPAVLAAATNSDWNAGGSLLTFYFPVVLFVIIAAVLSLQFGRPHKVPGHGSLAPSAVGPGAAAVGPETASSAETTATDTAADQGNETGGPVRPPAEGAE